MTKLLFISVPSDQLVIRDINLHSFDMISIAYVDKPVVDEVCLICDTTLADPSELESELSLCNSSKKRFFLCKQNLILH